MPLTMQQFGNFLELFNTINNSRATATMAEAAYMQETIIPILLADAKAEDARIAKLQKDAEEKAEAEAEKAKAAAEEAAKAAAERKSATAKAVKENQPDVELPGLENGTDPKKTPAKTPAKKT